MQEATTERQPSTSAKYAAWARERAKKPLNPRQFKFARFYAEAENPAEAARLAGYSERAAPTAARGLLCHPGVLAEIERCREDMRSVSTITRDRITREVARIALADPRKLFDEYGNILPPRDWPDDIALAVSAIGYTAKGQMTVKLHSKSEALDKLMRMFGMFEADNAQLKADPLSSLMDWLLARQQADRLPVAHAEVDPRMATEQDPPPLLPVSDSELPKK